MQSILFLNFSLDIKCNWNIIFIIYTCNFYFYFYTKIWIKIKLTGFKKTEALG